MTVDETTRMRLPAEIQAPALAAGPRCRANSRRGSIDPTRYSYAPVESASRALDILGIVNRLGIASIESIFHESGYPKPTIVRMLETLMFKGFVAKDNMVGGYRITSKVLDLISGYSGIPRVIELSRPFAIDLTREIKWPVGIGVISGEEILIQLWTGTISPIAHTNTVLGIRPDMQTSAMGRSYLAFCSPADRERHFMRFRSEPKRNFDAFAEKRLLGVLAQARHAGYASRDPQTKPHRTATVAMPILVDSEILGLMSVSFFRSVMTRKEIAERIIGPLRETTERINAAMSYSNGKYRAEVNMPDPQF